MDHTEDSAPEDLSMDVENVVKPDDDCKLIEEEPPISQPLERLESIASMIEPSFTKDEELIYEGDIENEPEEFQNEPEEEFKMELEEEEEEQVELIVDLTGGEFVLDTDTEPKQENNIVTQSTPTSVSKQQQRSETKTKAVSGDTEEPRFVLSLLVILFTGSFVAVVSFPHQLMI